jgi:predicted CoA-binding protein
MASFFDNIKTIAIVGLSTDPARPSNEVGTYLKSEGFKIIPINPNYQEVLGEKSYPDLHSVPKEIKIDVVDIFRKSEEVLPHVREAIERGDAHTIWMQEGIINSEAEKLAIEKGLNVVMNFCLMKAHKRKKN